MDHQDLSTEGAPVTSGGVSSYVATGTLCMNDLPTRTGDEMGWCCQTPAHVSLSQGAGIR